MSSAKIYKSRAVFIDRDGTINKDVRYLNNPDGLEIYPGVVEGIRLLNESMFKVIVITNQSGVSRGLYTHETVHAIHARMKSEFAKKYAHLDAVYYCPHKPEDNCECRKPKTKLFETAIEEFKIAPHLSFVIGDRMLDIEAGAKLGMTTVLVPEKGHEEDSKNEILASWAKPDNISKTFIEGVYWILSL